MKNFKTTRKSYLIALFMAISVATFWACKESSVNIDVPIDEIKSDLSQTLSVESLSKVEYFVSKTEGFIFNNTGDSRFNEFTELNEKEFKLYLKEIATKFANAKESTGGISTGEFTDYYYRLFLGLNEYSKKIYHKQLNLIPFEDFVSLFDNYSLEIVEKNKATLPTSIVNHLKKVSSNQNDNLRSTTACSTYSYRITTTTSTTGNRNCNFYANAGNIGTSDCDFEFVFSWNQNYSPASLKLNSSDVLVKGVLALGKINGRMASDKTVRFLIGKNRIYVVSLSTPSYFATKLKGYWG